MRLNADFNQRVVLRPDERTWVASPMAGVDRQMLDRIGAEVARATSIVRYGPDSYFSQHTHGGGEEFYVLEGVFSDEHGDYPAGTYVRNPIGSKHTPHAEDGCTIFVKLHQFDAADTAHKAIDTNAAEFRPGQASGCSVLPLHTHGPESVALVRLEPGTKFRPQAQSGGEEILVLDGTLLDAHGDYPAGTWRRSPPGSDHHSWSDEGCLIYVKTGHLAALIAAA